MSEYMEFLKEGFQAVDDFIKKLRKNNEMIKELENIQNHKFTLEELNKYLDNSPKTELLQNILKFEEKGYLSREETFEIFYKSKPAEENNYFEDDEYNYFQYLLTDVYSSKELGHPDDGSICEYFQHQFYFELQNKINHKAPTNKEILKMISFMKSKNTFKKFIKDKPEYKIDDIRKIKLEEYFIKNKCGLKPYEKEETKEIKWWKSKLKELGYLNRYDKVISKNIVREMRKNKRKLLQGE